MKGEVVIVDYGLGNLASIRNMIKKIGGSAEITGDISRISDAERLIIPGVGAFPKGMTNLKEKNLIGILNKKALEDRIPVMGICLGMQLLSNYSAEGNVEGLGWIDAETKKFDFDSKELKIPHMAWTDVNMIKKNHPIFEGINEVPRYYFVHSY